MTVNENPRATAVGSRVVHMTSAHSAFDTRIYYRQCRTLASAGHQTMLIVQHDVDENRNGVKIKALPTPSTRFQRMFGTTLRVLSTALKEDASLFHFHDPELMPIGIVLRLFGKRVIYDVHEDVPKQILTKAWIPSFMRPAIAKSLELLERLGARMFSGVIVAWPAIMPRFPEQKTVLIRNFPAVDELHVPDAIPYNERPLDVTYVGGITAIRGIREMVRALDVLNPDLGARLLLAGKFAPSSVESEIRSLSGWRHVQYLGWQSRSEVAALLGRVRIGLVLFQPAPNHMNSFPNKLFEYMSAGLPVVASDLPALREIVGSADAGLLVDPQNPAAIAEAIEYLLTHPEEAQNMGKRGRQAVEQHYNWEQEAETLLDFYQKVLAVP